MVLKHSLLESTLMIFNGLHLGCAIKILPRKIITISDLTKKDMDATWSVETPVLGLILNLLLIMLSKPLTLNKEIQSLVQ